MRQFGTDTLILATFCCFAAFAPNVAAQGSAPAATASGQIDPAKAADVLISSADKEFVLLIEAMPEDKFNFAPSAALFKDGNTAFDGVRTFAQLATHAIQANYFLWGAASGLKPDVDTAAIGKLKGKSEILAAAKASMEFGHRAAATLTATNAFEPLAPPSGSRFGAIAFGVMHLRDEYGQMVEYVRMNGIVPPATVGRPAANPSKK
jgi:hypothetical protein